MVPIFALSLSFEGIVLLRHMDGVWAKIAEVALDAPDLEAEVIGLRDQALALDPEGAKVALIIPNEQIRYLDAPDPGGDAEARDAAIRTALDGATPYAVDELAYDHAVDRGRLLIAAVAQETLDEAEKFARQHGFEGVSYMAQAPEYAFKGAVFFGKVKSWKGRTKRLPQPIEIVAPNEAALTPVAQPDPEPETAAPEQPEAQPAPEEPPMPEERLAAAAPSAALPDPVVTQEPPAPKPAAEPEAEPVPAPEPAETLKTDAEADAPPPAPEKPSGDIQPPAQADPDVGANFYFSTVRAALAEDGAANKLTKATRPEVQTRFTPVVGPAKPAADPNSTPKPAPNIKELAARERAVALAARVPGTNSDLGDAPPLPGATGRRFTPSNSPDSNLKGAAVTSGSIEADTDNAGQKSGAAAAAKKFLTRGSKPTEKAAQPKDIPPLGKPAPALGAKDPLPAPKVGALPKAPGTPSVSAPQGQDRAPDPISAPVAKPETASAKGFGKMAALRGASLNKPAPEPDPIPAKQRKAPFAKVAAFRGGKSDKSGAATPALNPASATALTPEDEAARMTVFGARNQEIGGKPRFLGLMLTAALLLFLAGVAAWASVFLQDGLAGLFRSNDAPVEAVASLPDTAQPVASPDPETTTTLAAPTTDEPAKDVQVAALETAPDAGQTPPPLAQPAPTQALTPEQAAATYAATGIWQRSPGAPMTPPEDGVDEVYAASIDPDVQELDAIALPDPLNMAQEPMFQDPGLPPPADMVFNFDARGLIKATPEGGLTPDGLRIYAGLPPAVPPNRPAFNAQKSPDSAAPDAKNPLSNTRPEARPSDLVEQRERATQTGISKAELASLRPVLRPQTAQEQAVVDTPESPATELAVDNSLLPVTRPRNMSAIVSRTEARREEQEAVQTASAAAVAPRTVQPSGTTAGSVARSATVRNAINLGKVSLIGVYGTPSNRRALVRLPSGQYKKVKVGDTFDGGRVAAISESELRYVKSGRNVTLKMPRG
ncbi:hypothetical protein [Primorskyibacter sp. 2E233]|uniref:hypothetical protein n=1 Tax=Primorskyibacter sp. 2E233 TaxID=3413431 RepID=UPI003BF3B9E3